MIIYLQSSKPSLASIHMYFNLIFAGFMIKTVLIYYREDLGTWPSSKIRKRKKAKKKYKPPDKSQPELFVRGEQ